MGQGQGRVIGVTQSLERGWITEDCEPQVVQVVSLFSVTSKLIKSKVVMVTLVGQVTE